MTYTIAAASKAAGGQVGYRESGVNQTKYNRWLGTIGGTYGYAWCASFQSWVAAQAGGRADIDYPKTAGCAVAVGWFKAHGRWSSTPHEGDWVFYGPNGSVHVELVVAVSSHSITTIGGNTSGSLDGRYYAGDGVYRKTVSRSSDRIYGYGRPNYEEDDMPSANEIAEAVMNAPVDTGDGKKPWRARTVLGHLEKSQDRIEAKIDAGNAAIGELSKTLAAVAADRGQVVDAEALVARIEQAIENVTVRLDVADGEDPS